MPSERFDFTNGRGEPRTGRLERPLGEPRAWALFVGSDAGLAERLGRALAWRGVGTLGCDGEAADVASAARAMAEAGRPASLLIGHGAGGAAVLAAAADVAEVRAVAVIGALAPAGGQPIAPETIAHLHRALLVLHSPLDEAAAIDNASAVFLAAKHPKSFVSLDHADHLLSRPEDADYAAGVIFAWASRYLPAAEGARASAAPGEVFVRETGGGRFQVEVFAAGMRFFADEPVQVGGLGSGPSPHELVSAGLAACTAMTARLYAERKAWPLERVRVTVRHDSPPSRFARRIAFDGPLEPEQVARLFEIADKCPVHRTLEGASVIETAPLDAPLPATPENPATEHFGAMDRAYNRVD